MQATIDLFGGSTPAAAPAPGTSAPALSDMPPEILHKHTYDEFRHEKPSALTSTGATPTPKNFSPARPDLPRVANTVKIENENSKKNTKTENPKSENEKVCVIDNPEERANRLRIQEEDETAPKPHSAWMDRPQWHERRAPPLRRGYHNQYANIQSILAQVETPKPELPEGLAEAEPAVIVDWLIAFVEAGGTKTDFCRRSGLSTYRLDKAISKVDGAAERFDTARRTVGADALAEEALRIATEPLMTEESIETYDKDDELVTRSVKRADNVYARKLAYQARMQVLQKWAPERYGENVKPAVGDSMAEKLRKARDRLRGEYYAARRELSLPPGATEYPSSHSTAKEPTT